MTINDNFSSDLTLYYIKALAEECKNNKDAKETFYQVVLKSLSTLSGDYLLELRKIVKENTSTFSFEVIK